MIFLAIYLTGYLVTGSIKTIDVLQDPPSRVLSKKEEIGFVWMGAALWPVALPIALYDETTKDNGEK